MKKKLIIFGLALVVLIAGGVFAYREFFPKPGIKVFETAKAKKANIKEVLVETGIIKPRVDAVIKVGARATGTNPYNFKLNKSKIYSS